MALISCPKCGNSVSEYADVCPNCGAPIQKTVQKKRVGLAVLLLVGFVIAITVAAFFVITQRRTVAIPGEFFRNTPTPAATKKTSGDEDSVSDILSVVTDDLTGKVRMMARMQPYSRSEIISILRHTGSTKQQATLAADISGVDWNEQAVRKAVDVRRGNSQITRDALCEALRQAGFTEDEAAYGADRCGMIKFP